MSVSIRTRLALTYAAVVVAALALFSAGAFALQMRWGRAQFDSELSSIGASVAHAMEEEFDENDSFERAVEETRSSTDIPGRATAVLDASGVPVGAHWQGFSYDRAAVASALPRPGIATVSSGGRAWRVLLRRERSRSADYLILVAGPLDQVMRERNTLARVFLTGTPLVALLTALLCWWVASAALRPVTTMAAQAEALTAQSSDWKLDVPPANDELGQLSRAFNRLLARLETASAQQRQFMADASHELRTPVSVIRTAAEVTLDRDAREPEEYRDALAIVGEQSLRLSRMVEDMLVLARADAGGYALVRRPLYLDEVVLECVRAASVVASTRQVEIVTVLEASDVCVVADDGLIRQLVTNLLDNAVRYSPTGATVAVGLTSNASTATITVEDAGPGIPEADRERVFDRFVRLDAARSETPGAGLGLPIARWIAGQHGGTITIEGGSRGGCRFVVAIPLRPAAAANMKRT